MKEQIKAEEQVMGCLWRLERAFVREVLIYLSLPLLFLSFYFLLISQITNFKARRFFLLLIIVVAGLFPFVSFTSGNKIALESASVSTENVYATDNNVEVVLESGFPVGQSILV